MATFGPEQIYVPLDCGEPAENRALAIELRGTGVNMLAGVNVIETLGLKPTMDMISRQKYVNTLVDMHYRSVKADIESSLEKIRGHHAVGYVTLSPQDSMASLSRAVSYNNGLQIALKGVDSDISEEEFLARRGRSISAEVESIVQDAQQLGISALMGAGADVDLTEGFDYFATGIRPNSQLEDCASFEDDQERPSDPVYVLTHNPTAKLVIGRLITRARDPVAAVGSIVEYANKG